MKNLKRIFSILMVALLMVTMTSCGKKKVSLTKAFENTAKIKSYKFKSDLKLGVDSPDVPAETAALLEGLDIVIEGAAKRETINDAQLKADISFNVQGISMTLETFYDFAFNNDDFKYNCFIEIPELLKNDPMLGQLFQGKKFAFLGLDKETLIEKLNITEVDLEGNDTDTEAAKKYGEHLNKFLKDYYEKNKDTFSKYVEETEFELNGETVTLPSYEVTLTNDAIRDLVTAYLENDDNIQNLIDLVNASSTGEIDEETMRSELKDALEEVANMPDFLSEDGAKITFAIQDGKIVKGIYDLNILIEGTKISYKVNSDIFDINEPVEIEFPDQNGEDVLNLLDLATMFGM